MGQCISKLSGGVTTHPRSWRTDGGYYFSRQRESTFCKLCSRRPLSDVVFISDRFAGRTGEPGLPTEAPGPPKPRSAKARPPIGSGGPRYLVRFAPTVEHSLARLDTRTRLWPVKIRVGSAWRIRNLSVRRWELFLSTTAGPTLCRGIRLTVSPRSERALDGRFDSPVPYRSSPRAASQKGGPRRAQSLKRPVSGWSKNASATSLDSG